jgi:uncharacterized protein DUF6412
VFAVTTLHAFIAGWQLLSQPELTAGAMMAFAAVVLARLALAFPAYAARIAAAVTARPLRGRASSLRRKSWAAVFQRLLNPDSAGRSRPRAPSAAPAAA